MRLTYRQELELYLVLAIALSDCRSKIRERLDLSSVELDDMKRFVMKKLADKFKVYQV